MISSLNIDIAEIRGIDPEALEIQKADDWFLNDAWSRHGARFFWSSPAGKSENHGIKNVKNIDDVPSKPTFFSDDFRSPRLVARGLNDFLGTLLSLLWAWIHGFDITSAASLSK